MTNRLIKINASYQGISITAYRLLRLKKAINNIKYNIFVLLPIYFNNNELPDIDSIGLNRKYWTK